MRRIVTVSVAFALTFSLLGCAGSKEDAKKQLDEMLTNMTELGNALAGIKDEASAKAAMPKINEIGEKMKKMKENEVKVTKTIQDELMKEYESKLTEAGMKIGMESMRVSQYPTGKQAADEAKKMIDALAKK